MADNVSGGEHHTDEDYALCLSLQEEDQLNDLETARHLQSGLQEDDAIIVDDEEDSHRSEWQTSQDEVLARRLQRQYDTESTHQNGRSTFAARQHHLSRMNEPRVYVRGHRARVSQDFPFLDDRAFVSASNRVGSRRGGRNNVRININGVDILDEQLEADGDDYESLLELEDQIGDVQHRGLNSDEVDILPTSKFTSNRTSSSQCDGDNVDAECRVCLSTFCPNELLRTLPCLHRFHRHCIDEWITRNAVCPVCRVKIRDQINGNSSRH